MQHVRWNSTLEHKDEWTAVARGLHMTHMKSGLVLVVLNRAYTSASITVSRPLT